MESIKCVLTGLGLILLALSITTILVGWIILYTYLYIQGYYYAVLMIIVPVVSVMAYLSGKAWRNVK